MGLVLLAESDDRKIMAQSNLVVSGETTVIVNVHRVDHEHFIIEMVLRGMLNVTLVRVVRDAVLRKVSPLVSSINSKVDVDLCVVVVEAVVVADPVEIPI